MKKDRRTVPAIPSKRMYQSIIADYDTETSLCELIDNALDAWVKGGKSKLLEILLTIDVQQQVIVVIDNAGGIKESDILNIIAPGHTSNLGDESTIGVFGVGSKRAVVALGQKIKISTRFANEKTLVVEYDDQWLQQDTWEMEYYTETINISPASTKVEVTMLRSVLDESLIERLYEHIGSTYARFLTTKSVRIKINGDPLKAVVYDKSWSYPPNYEPQNVTFSIPVESERSIDVQLIGGLIGKDQVGEGRYGVYFYCNDRLVLQADKSYDFGFSIGQAGLPHPQLNLMRVIVNMTGSPIRMPWNSSKTGINFKNAIFQRIRPRIVQLVTYYARLARKFVGDVDENVYKFNKGQITEAKLDDPEKPIKLYTLPVPIKKEEYGSLLNRLNKDIATDKPWVKGLYEGLIVVDNLVQSNLTQRNRFSLIILDSTLEIAMKEYLAHFAGKANKIAKAKLINILSNRADVEQAVGARRKDIARKTWNLVNHFYLMRNKLIHEVATADVKVEDVNQYREVVEGILSKLFKLKFTE